LAGQTPPGGEPKEKEEEGKKKKRQNVSLFVAVSLAELFKLFICQ
jgi:hypothetical protein